MFYVYVLQSQKTKRYYTGSTERLRERMNEHNAGECKSTRSGIPWNLLYTKDISNIYDLLFGIDFYSDICLFYKLVYKGHLGLLIIAIFKFLLTVSISVLSWHLIEKKFLDFKKYFVYK